MSALLSKYIQNLTDSHYLLWYHHGQSHPPLSPGLGQNLTPSFCFSTGLPEWSFQIPSQISSLHSSKLPRDCSQLTHREQPPRLARPFITHALSPTPLTPIFSRANSICQPVDLLLLSPMISSYSAARSVTVSLLRSTCQPLDQHLSAAW